MLELPYCQWLSNKSIQNKDRRFIWAEISFFQRWWTEQNQETKDLVKKYVPYCRGTYSCSPQAGR